MLLSLVSSLPSVHNIHGKSAYANISAKLDSVYCMTKDCIRTSSNLLKNVNLSADPCEDFYEFGCGTYMVKQRVPDDKGRWSSFDVIEELIAQNGRQLLEAKPSVGDFDSYQLARDHYHACLDQKTREKLGVQPLLRKLAEAGGWPVVEAENWSREQTFKWWEWTYKMNDAGFPIDALVSFGSMPDDKNTSWNIFVLDEASLGLPREYLVNGFDDRVVQLYYKYMVDAAVLMGADKARAKLELKESLLFEISLAKITRAKEEIRDSSESYNPTILSGVPMFDGLPPSWTLYVQTLLKSAFKVLIDEKERVNLPFLGYFEKLSGLLANTSTRTLANYLGWQATQSVMALLNKDAFMIKQAFDKTMSGSQESLNWKHCVAVIGFNSFSGSLGLIAGSMYVRKFFNPKAKEVMEEMTTYIREAFKIDILEKVDWMDDRTRMQAIRKLSKMDQYIGYSNEFVSKVVVDGIHHGLKLNATTYFQNALNIIKFWRTFYYNRHMEKRNWKSWLEHADVTVVNAFYNGMANFVEFPAGILQGVFFNENIPKYMTFASIGNMIGHEITHGFDDRGRQRNAKGELENWWLPETEKNFKSKAQCFVDQFSNYKDPEVNLFLNGVNLQGESIADGGGLKEAYYAYKRWAAVHPVEPKLVGFPYTPRQMFWISFSQVWCLKFKPEDLKSEILTGNHAPGKYRVIGTLSNIEEFAADFKCPLGSKMNPRKKCVVW